MTILQQNFFARPTLTVAYELLGKTLVRNIDGRRLSARIVETEAYIGPNDTACHASKGRTPRTEVMFGPAGFTYIYLVYGMYYMLNLITEQEEFPAAVLIRAVEPLEGIELMRAHRQKPMPDVNLTNGPGKLCLALKIDKGLNKWDVTTGQNLWLEAGNNKAHITVAAGPRIGIGYALPQDKMAPWRFWVRGNRFVSKG